MSPTKDPEGELLLTGLDRKRILARLTRVLHEKLEQLETVHMLLTKIKQQLETWDTNTAIPLRKKDTWLAMQTLMCFSAYREQLDSLKKEYDI